jgi:hypothetical protein
MSEPVFNKSKKHSIMRGIDNVEYRQNGNYFDIHGKFVRPAPDTERVIQTDTKRPVLSLKPKGITREEILRRAEAQIARQAVGGIPKAVTDAAKENAKALEAESQAE